MRIQSRTPSELMNVIPARSSASRPPCARPSSAHQVGALVDRAREQQRVAVRRETAKAAHDVFSTNTLYDEQGMRSAGG